MLTASRFPLPVLLLVLAAIALVGCNSAASEQDTSPNAAAQAPPDGPIDVCGAEAANNPNVESVFKAYASTAGLVASWEEAPRGPGQAHVPISQFRSLAADTPLTVCLFDGDFPKSPPPPESGTPQPNFNRELIVIAGESRVPLALGYRANLPADYGPEAAP